MIEIRDWRARYARGFALGPVDVTLERGQTVALLGANGAGKTTFVKSLTGSLPAEGSLEFDGEPHDPASPRWLRRIGYLPDSPREIIEEFTAGEYLDFLIGMRSRHLGRDLARRAADHSRHLAQILALDLDNATAIAGYSLGMRKKTQLVATLMFRPELLILDEPRNGLDPYGIEAMVTVLESAAADGATLLVASHDLDWCFARCQAFIGLARGEQKLCGLTAEYPDSLAFKQSVLGALQ